MEAYRYGFNGKEHDNEVSGTGNQYDYGFRIYNPRLGKFLSVDPLTGSYPFYSPYQFAGNMPIWAIDVDGLEPALNTQTGQASLTSNFHFVNNGVTPQQFATFQQTFAANVAQLQGQTFTHTDGNTYSVGTNYTFDTNVPTALGPADVIVNIMPDNGQRSSATGHFSTSNSTLNMNVNAAGNTDTHEYLHTLGLDDRYNYLTYGDHNGAIQSATMEAAIMPAGQVGENLATYQPRTNIMADGSQAGITNLQWQIIFNGQREDNNQSTIFLEGNATRLGVRTLSQPFILGVVNSNIVFANGTSVANTAVHGYLGSDGRMDDGRYNQGTSYGAKVSTYFGLSPPYGNGAQSSQWFLSPYNGGGLGFLGTTHQEFIRGN